MNSGNKVGVNVGYNYPLSGDPGMYSALAVDLPFASKAAFTFNVGFENTVIDKYENSDITNKASYIYMTVINKTTNYTVKRINVAEGTGEVRYIVMSGLFKYFIKSLWMGGGLTYYRFLSGYIQEKIPDTVYYYTYKIDSYPHDLYAAFSMGYLSEIKENVFLMPEFRFSYCLPPGRPRSVASISAGLLFKL
jgi:hypothetical protein